MVNKLALQKREKLRESTRTRVEKDRRWVLGNRSAMGRGLRWLIERHWASTMGEEEDESGRRWSVSFGVTVRTMMADEEERALRCDSEDDEDEREPLCDCDGVFRNKKGKKKLVPKITKWEALMRLGPRLKRGRRPFLWPHFKNGAFVVVFGPRFPKTGL